MSYNPSLSLVEERTRAPSPRREY